MTEQDKTARIVNQLFERLIAINPAFKQAWPTEEEFRATKKEWTLAFAESGINSIEQIKKGLAKQRLSASPFVPSPGAFMASCKASPEDIGAPAIELAYDEACRKSHPSYGDNKNWSHPVVLHARNKVGSHKLTGLDRKSTFPAYKEAYLDSCDQHAFGSNLNQLEQQKNVNFTQVQMHWIMIYKSCVKDDIDPMKSKRFPDASLAEIARDLYLQYTKLGGQKDV